MAPFRTPFILPSAFPHKRGAYRVPVKRHRGEPGHTRDTRDTRDTRTHKGTQTNLTTNQTHQQQTPRTSARRPKPRPTQVQPQARSRPLPAADSEEAAPSKPDPASARSQSASPRLLKGGRRNEGACGRCVTAGGAVHVAANLGANRRRNPPSSGKQRQRANRLSFRLPDGGTRLLR